MEGVGCVLTKTREHFDNKEMHMDMPDIFPISPL